MKVLTSAQMRHTEDEASRLGVPADQLMENAGLATANVGAELLGGASGRSVLVLVGPGNNGGDGLVAARRLAGMGAHVTVALCAQRRPGDHRFAETIDAGVPILDIAEDAGLARARVLLMSTNLVLDAVLGTGHIRPLAGATAGLFRLVAEARRSRSDLKLLALDLPSGVHADTGEADPLALHVDVTVAYGAPKPCHFLFPAAALAGRLRVADIGVPHGCVAGLDAPELITAGWARDALPARPLNAHKGSFGRVLVVAGSPNYVGAAYLACVGAGRAGAGYVTLAVPPALYSILASKLTEATYLLLPPVTPGMYAPETSRAIRDALEASDALLIGPGLGQRPSLGMLVRRVLLRATGPTVPTLVDADALNALAQTPEWWRQLAGPAVLTPHPGEMARLLDTTVGAVESDRWGLTSAAARRWSVTVVLKGAYTVVASPEGPLRICPYANPALATAGTGDVLSGIIAGLLAQGMPPYDAACLGVYVHAVAGELTREEVGEAGALASDLLPRVPRAISLLRSGQWADPIR
jgi:NAD(P)H-hydrate epimerase